MRLATLCLLFASPILAAEPANWEELLQAGPDSPWKMIDERWILSKEVTLDSTKPKLLKADSATGNIWVNGTTGRVRDLHTRKSYGDCEVHVEFLLGQKSNSGIKFHDVYEIQLVDSAGTPMDKLSGDSCGGIYPRAELKPRYHHIDKGIAPKLNAAKPAGEWQTLSVVFRAPRFDSTGKKVENAKIIQATLNGQRIHENQELATPTGNNWSKPEHPTGSFMLQADHGPVAFRNVKIRSLNGK